MISSVVVGAAALHFQKVLTRVIARTVPSSRSIISSMKIVMRAALTDHKVKGVVPVCTATTTIPTYDWQL
jgi:hypothetical protein